MEQQYLDVFRKCVLFRGLDAEDALRQLGGTLLTCPAETFLVQEGERVENLHVLLSGNLRAVKFMPDGKEFLYQNITPGFIAGGEAVCTRKKTSPYAVYAVDDSEIWDIPWSCMESDSLSPELRCALLYNLLYFVGDMNIRKFYKIDALSVRGVRERIWKYLRAQANRTGQQSFTIPFDREDMANYLCVNRSVLSHELRLMEEEGLIRFRKNQFTLLDK